MSYRRRKLFELIVEYVDDHYRECDLTLKKVAQVFAYTEKYLSHLFKQNMYVGFNTYVGDKRFRYAQTLIEQGVLSVTDVAAAAGYRDASYFSKIFKTKTGCAPTAYMAGEEV